jgi:LmbE family N-acetylglucosaminyl deacetylase
MFLGYPDGGLAAIRSQHPSDRSSFTSEHGVSATYGGRGLGGADYHTHRFGEPGQYNWPTIVADLVDIINRERPRHIFTTSQWETHSDHITTYFLVIEAVKRVIRGAPDYNPTVHKTAVWPGDESWPPPSDGSTYFTEPARTTMGDPKAMIWRDRESLDVPSVMQSGLGPDNPKYFAIAAHESQGGMGRYIGRWMHKDEFFWLEQVAGLNEPPVPNAGLDQRVDEGAVVTLDGRGSRDRRLGVITHQWRQVGGPTVNLENGTSPQPQFTAPSGLPADAELEFELVVSDGSLTSVPDAVRVIVKTAAKPVTYGRNVATLAALSASTAREASGAAKIADGVMDGYPRDPSREWVTTGEKAGAWISMNWPRPVSIGKIVLHDRPNLADQVIAGTVEFSDGSKIAIGSLPNDGKAGEYAFPQRTVRSLRLVVTQVSASTENVGLAEVEVFETAEGGSAKTSITPEIGMPPNVAATPPGRGLPKPETTGGAAATTPAAAIVRGNIAPTATVSASSERPPAQTARKAVDNMAGGYPAQPDREWSTAGETGGAWIELQWKTTHVVNHVRLHDRPNPDDHVLSGTLTFSNGPPISVGALSNDGTGVDIEFPPRAVRWVRFTINSASAATANAGLAELLVFESGKSP